MGSSEMEKELEHSMRLRVSSAQQETLRGEESRCNDVANEILRKNRTNSKEFKRVCL